MVSAAVAILLAIVVFVATPLVTLKRLRLAIEARNPAAVARMVDFTALRANLGRTEDRKIHRANEGAFLGSLKNWIGEHVADGVLDKIATPKGLIRLVCDGETDADFDETRKEPCPLDGKTTNMHYLSYDRFRIDMTGKSGKNLSLVFDRYEVYSWRLVNATGATGA